MESDRRVARGCGVPPAAGDGGGGVRGTRGSTPGDRAGAAAAARVETDWCIDGMTALDEDVCYVLPPLAQGTAPRLSHGSRRPFYIGYDAYGAESKKGAKALATVTSAARWPTKLAEHPVGHGARDVYLDEAFVFCDAN